MASNKLQDRLKKAEEALKEWEDRVPVNNMGKWAKSVAIRSKQKTVDKLKRDIERTNRQKL
jgi:hypothetical protein